ncbi:hypothetical protein [Blastococcus brunescens]|uniref:Lipoprotein n=1 Tax=Blastococcus brunescens TaxID=1564165 RepID=A0ABZ1B2G9_9ACTN|nr:hypothetical protein [Blastococcus sp. BMG 8361]WRL63544.1 hypothetical protein U6N30_28225 [Blastococcus sp. BMG 8361]
MRIPRLTAVIAATLLLAACGGSPLEGKTAEEIVTAAADVLEDAGSVHVSGAIDQDGQEGEVDLHLQGEDATGTISLGGAEVELLSVDGTSYLKASPEFWASFGMPEGMTTLFEDQWIVLPGEAAGQFGDFTLAGIVEELRNPESPLGDEVRTDELDGEDVVVVEQEDGSTLTVADDEKPYPLRMTGDDTPDGITFSRFGETEDITVPDDALDLEDMMGGA